MGENNQTVQVTESTDFNVTDQSQIQADANIVVTQNSGLMENDPFQEKTTGGESPVPNQADTGATIEEPNPIVEQQIALDVNVEDVFEGGTTKEDEITQIVTDTMNNNGQPVQPTMPMAPAIAIPTTVPEAPVIPTSQVVELQPAPATAVPVADQIITLEPTAPTSNEEVVDSQAPSLEQIIPQTAVPVEQPMVQPEIPVTIEQTAMPAIEAPQVDEEVPTEAPNQDAVAQQIASSAPISVPNVEIPLPEIQAMTATPAATAPAQVATPIIEQPQMVVEQPLMAAPAAPAIPVSTEAPVIEQTQAVVEQSAVEATAIPNTNPFEGVAVATTTIETQMSPIPEFTQADAAPVMATPEVQAIPVPTEVPVVEQPQMVMEQPVMPTPEVQAIPVPTEVPIVEQPQMVMEQPVMAAPEVQSIPVPTEVPVVEQPQMVTEQPVMAAPEVQAIPVPTEVPVVEQPQMVMEQPVMAAPEVQAIPVPTEVPVVEQPQMVMEQPVMPTPEVQAIPVPTEVPVVETNDITNTNPFEGMAPVEAPTLETQMAPIPEFTQADVAPVMETAPAQIEAPTIEQPVLEPTMVSVPEIIQNPEPSEPEVAPVEEPNIEVPTEEPIPTPNIEEKNETPEVEQPNMMSLADAISVPATPIEDDGQTADEIINQFITNSEKSTLPETDEVTLSNENVEPEETVSKTVILQSNPLGKVKPVAPIAVIKQNENGEIIDSKSDEVKEGIVPKEKVNKLGTKKPKKKIEPATESKEKPIIIPDKDEEKIESSVIIEEENTEIDSKTKKKPKKKKLSMEEIDEMAINALVAKAKGKEEDISVEHGLFVVLDDEKVEEKPKKRKIIRKNDQHKPTKSIEIKEEKPFVQFCVSCGNVLGQDDIICPHCGEPIK